jgi:transcriptional regulator of acetoin/glycerol metabolism
MTLRNVLEHAETIAIKKALLDSSGNVSAASRALGIPLRTLWNRMIRLNIRPHDYRLKLID